MSSNRTCLGAVLWLAACRSDGVGPISIEQTPSGSPVRVTEVRGRMSYVVGLGNGPAVLTSEDARDNQNSASAPFHVLVEQSPPEGLQIASTSTCRVGDWTIAQPLTWNGSIDGTAVGSTREFQAQFMPTPVAAGRPSACEFSMFAGSPARPPSTTAVTQRIEPVRLATVCWTPDAIVEGPCSSEALPRVADVDAPLGVPVVQGAIAKTQDGKGYGVRFDYLVTAKTAPPATTRVVAHARCQVQGQMVEASAHSLLQIDHLAPGESLAGDGYAFSDRPFATAPEHCTIELQSLVGGPPPERTTLASWCIRAGGTTVGSCA